MLSNQLTWKPFSGARRYEVYRSVDGGAFSLLASVTAAAYLDAGLAQGQTYVYRIDTIDGTSNVAQSQILPAVTAGVSSSLPVIATNSALFLSQDIGNIPLAPTASSFQLSGNTPILTIEARNAGFDIVLFTEQDTTFRHSSLLLLEGTQDQVVAAGQSIRFKSNGFGVWEQQVTSLANSGYASGPVTVNINQPTKVQRGHEQLLVSEDSANPTSLTVPAGANNALISVTAHPTVLSAAYAGDRNSQAGLADLVRFTSNGGPLGGIQDGIVMGHGDKFELDSATSLSQFQAFSRTNSAATGSDIRPAMTVLYFEVS